MEEAPPTSKCWASHLQAPPTQCPFCTTGHSHWGSTSVCRCFEPLSAMFILCLLSCSLTGCWYTSTAGPQRASMQKDMWCVTSDKPETCMQPSESSWQKMTFSSYLPRKLRSDFPEALGLRIDALGAVQGLIRRKERCQILWGSQIVGKMHPGLSRFSFFLSQTQVGLWYRIHSLQLHSSSIFTSSSCACHVLTVTIYPILQLEGRQP